MGTEIKIFSTTFGYIIGRQIEETEKFFRLKNPGIVQAVQTKNGPQLVITEMLPPILKNRKKISKNLPVKKTSILYDDEVTPEFAERYRFYEKQMIQKETGIEVVGKEALNKIQGLKNAGNNFIKGKR